MPPAYATQRLALHCLVSSNSPARENTNPNSLNVLLVGGGGREHALAQAIAASPKLGTLYTSHPGNPGIAAVATPADAPIDAAQAYRAELFCRDHNIDLVVVGPEAPLAEGLADSLRRKGVAVFGPNKDGAQLEADKHWAKDLMRGAAVPTAESRSFTDAEQAVQYSLSRTEPPVIKATGLAAGKGVVVPSTHKEAADAIRWMLNDKAFGDASSRVLIEERLEGPEVSVFALTDGTGVYILDACQDHKRLLDGDEGPNTGGMGAFCPSTLIDDNMMSRIQREILLPVIDSMRREGIDYRGVLYAGLMLTHSGPKVLEFNVRFGDPECQVLMPRLASDALEMLYATAMGNVESLELAWHPGAAVCVVLASEGYPQKPITGQAITGLDEAAEMEGVFVYHAGTKHEDASGQVITAGGRVLGVTALGDDLEQAKDRAYAAADKIRFNGMQVRRDIAAATVIAPAASRNS
ncbi:MAG: phosphoribosylamine--glycine ligase [Phycisphaerales bacterium]|nr:phosphoribosylamine--glycine ligase [Phycisphaerales bacterium]